MREASADLAAACLLEPSNAAFLRNRGVNARTNGDYAAALADLTQVLRLAPDDTVALANRGCRPNLQLSATQPFSLSATLWAARTPQDLDSSTCRVLYFDRLNKNTLMAQLS